jgi:molybdenum-dependent DNA-binding transcriptional regulator ModE
MARLKLKLQLYCGDEIAMGPGKADLLEAIAREGSISGAGRAMGMSYRRAWLLVDVMNRCFVKPLVETHPGGGKLAGGEADSGGRGGAGRVSRALGASRRRRLRRGIRSLGASDPIRTFALATLTTHPSSFPRRREPRAR